jgi:hypothetical protein
MPTLKRGAVVALGLFLLLMPGGLLLVCLAWLYRKIHRREWAATPATHAQVN